MTEKELEKAIKKIYGDAYVDLAYKTEAFLKASELRDKKMKQDLLNGVITQKKYNDWKIGQTLIGKRWEEYSEVIATDMLNADNLAREAIKGSLAVTMAEGMNRAMWEASKIGTLEAGFTLYDKNAVLRLIKDQPEILPALKPDSPTERAIREGRIKRWNKQHLRSELTQGILQGESTGKIAKRMQNVVGMEQRASMRNARTAMTSAFNAGKEVGYKEAEDMGIELEQMWVAIYDDRTRHEHRMLDGQIRKVGEPFEIDGYEIGFPGDPSGEPEMVYNCRCRVVAITAGLKAVDPDIYKRPENLEVEEQEYEEWKHQLEKPEKPETIPEQPVIEVQPEATEEPEKTAEPFVNERLEQVMGDNYQEFADLLTEDNPTRYLYEKYTDQLDGITYTNEGSYYTDVTNHVYFQYNNKEGMSKYRTFTHEMGHAFDHNMIDQGATHNEVMELNYYFRGYFQINETVSSSDMFISAMRDDSKLYDDLKISELYKVWRTDATKRGETVGVQDFLDGFFNTQKKYGCWGHGSAYYNRMYNKRVERFGLDQRLKEAMSYIGIDGSNAEKRKKYMRTFDISSELWANINSAVTVGGEELEAVKKYLPNSYEAYMKIIQRNK